MNMNMMVVLASLCFVAYILYMLILITPAFVVDAWIFMTKKVRKFRIHIQRWNVWRKRNTNSWFHKLLVLLGLQLSPTFKLTLTQEESKNIIAAMQEALKIYKEDSENDIGK